MSFRGLLSAMVFVAVFLGAVVSQAYFIASEPRVLKPGVPTDVFVAGYGDDQGTQFLKAAILGAQVSRDRFPQRQRVIISAVSESFGMERAMLANAGFGFRKEDNDDLSRSRLVAAISYLRTPVSSLQFYGHANTYNGFRLQSRTDRLDQEDAEFAEIGKYLAPSAFVVFHSCNSGWKLAPAAAAMWRRPVFGSFASSDFQEPMTDGQWYYHDVGMYPAGYSRIGMTSQLLQSSIECTTKKCLRLKPTNSPYVDSFGKFSRGLGFYKVFSTNEALIPQALVHLTLLTPSVVPLNMQSSRADMEKAVVDWMCPSDKAGKRRQACAEAVAKREFATNRYLSFFFGQPVACSFRSCQTTIKCNAFKKIVGAVPCKTQELSDAQSTAFSDQMNMMMKGLDLFEKGQLSF